MGSYQRHLRITSRFQEIYTLLFNSIETEGCFVWRSIDPKRTRYPVSLKSIDPNQTTLTVRTLDSDRPFSQNESLYLRLGLRDSAVKTRILTKEGSDLTLEFPTQIALEEGRKKPRYYFHPSEGKTAQIRTPMDRIRGQVGRSYQVVVSDISSGGVAIFIPPSLRDYFEVRSQISVLSLGTQKFTKPLVGEVLFNIPSNIRSGIVGRSGYKVGIQVPPGFESEVVDRFVNKRVLFSITEEQIVRDEDFRSQVSENMEHIKKTLSKEKHLKDWFDQFEPNRAENHYLRQHVHLLCQVLTGLGTRLGWISERSIDKLIYVAYLHDIRLAKMPHLLKIGSGVSIDQPMRHLSQEDRTATLEAPAYAAEIARRDLEAYPDALTMLLQQKELPDGSGYPHGLSASQIAPLSALFIVSHYFVDYVIDHPDWSPRDFVKTYRPRLKGQYFNKIFDAIYR